MLRTFLTVLLATASTAAAHNGEIAFAVPATGLTVDGDLADWPATAQYDISRTELGAAPTDAADFHGRFRVAHDGADLWVAVQIDDADFAASGHVPASPQELSQLLRQLGWRRWRGGEELPSPPDGVAVVVEVGHAGEERVARLAVDGHGETTVLTPDDAWSPVVDATMIRRGGRRTYEMRISLGAESQTRGSTLGFDLTAVDRDGDEVSWMTWGAGAGKLWDSRAGTRADLMLVDEAPRLRLHGRAVWSISGDTPPRAVNVQTATGARWVVETAADGAFETLAPAGGYVLTIEDPRLGLDRQEHAVVLDAASGPLQVVDTPLFHLAALTEAPPPVTVRHRPPPTRQRGVSWVGSRIVGAEHLAPLEPLHVDWIVQTPFGWQSDIHAPTLQAPTGEAGLWGESDRGVAITAALARQRGIATLLKPHLWTGRGSWRGELAMVTEDHWEEWFAQYESFILHYAELAQANGIEALCIGTELSATLHREAEWRRIIARVRQVYGGWLIYAANWTHFEDVPFWDAVDMIGVQAYFPLAAEPTDDVDVLAAGWEPWLERLEAVARREDRRVVFTEIGYRTNTNAAVEPWLWERQTSGGGDAAGRRTQQACYEAFFHAVWPRDWVGGAYFWKWFPHHERAGGDEDDGFTPQRKPAQVTLAERYRSTMELEMPGVPVPAAVLPTVAGGE
jgi:hypothetical protein